MERGAAGRLGVFVCPFFPKLFAGAGQAHDNERQQPKQHPNHRHHHRHRQDRRAFLEAASKGCGRFELNRSAWALESEVKQIGGLIYW